MSEATRLKLELTLHDAEVAGKKSAPDVITGTTLSNNTTARKVRKLKEGPFTAFPELVQEIFKTNKWPTSEVIGKRTTEDATLPESDIRRLRIEYLVKLSEMIREDHEKPKSGFDGVMDRVFVNKYEGNLARLSKAAVDAFPQSEQHLPWLRFGVACSAEIESGIHEQINLAMSIRMQTYLQAIAIRLKLELALYEAEVAAKKAAPGR